MVIACCGGVGALTLIEPAVYTSLSCLSSPSLTRFFGPQYNGFALTLGDRLAVGRRALDPLAGVRILLPQPHAVASDCAPLLQPA